MRRRIIIILIIIILLLAGAVALVLMRKSSPEPTAPPSPAPSPTPTEPPQTYEYHAPDLSADEIILLTGKIVVRSIGTYNSEDEFFRNLRQVEPYVTQELWQKLQAIIDAGISESQPPFEQIAAIVSEQIVSKNILTAEGRYEVDVWRSDTGKTARQTVTVTFGRFGENWYVNGTSQIQ